MLGEFVAAVADREIRSRPDVAAVRAALHGAKVGAQCLARDGRLRDQRRVNLQAELRDCPDRREIVGLLRALVRAYREDRPRGRGDWPLKAQSAHAAKELLAALLDDYPFLALELRTLTGPDGFIGLPLPPLLRRERRGDPFAGVKREADEALAEARVPRPWRRRLLAAVGVK